jgi:hypothetical protein
VSSNDTITSSARRSARAGERSSSRPLTSGSRERTALAVRLDRYRAGAERGQTIREPELAGLNTSFALGTHGITEIAASFDVSVEAAGDPGLRSHERLQRRDRHAARGDIRLRAVEVRQLRRQRTAHGAVEGLRLEFGHRQHAVGERNVRLPGARLDRPGR